MMRGSSLKLSVGALLLVATVLAAMAAAQAPRSVKATAKPAHRVVACYFHRTVRCPTCLKVGAAVEAALESGFAAELQDGRLEWVMIDFQGPRNQAYTNAFRITGPSLILMDSQNGKVTNWKPLPRAWGLVGNQPALFQYVQTEVRGFLAASQVSPKSVSPK